MKIIKASVEFMTPVDGGEVMKRLEQCGRVCYKSEGKIEDGSAEKFIRGIVARGHEAVLEHCGFTVKFICDRGVSHEIVRHRLASYCQESTRYCNYSSDQFGTEITVIEPLYLERGSAAARHTVCGGTLANRQKRHILICLVRAVRRRRRVRCCRTV